MHNRSGSAGPSEVSLGKVFVVVALDLIGTCITVEKRESAILATLANFST